jgi:hypothetical protein
MRDLHGTERVAELLDDAAQRNRLLLHQVPRHGVSGFVAEVAAGKPGDGRRDIFHINRLKRRRAFCGGKIDRQRGQRPQHRAAAIGRGCDDKTRPQDGVGDAEDGDQPLGFALCRADGGAVLIGGAGNRDLHEADRAAARLDRAQQPLDEIAVHVARVAARAVLQHAETIDHEINLVVADQPRQRGGIHRQQRQFQVERAGLLRSRKPPRDPDHIKAARAQIVGDEPPDQAGRPEHQDFLRVAHRALL